MSLPDFVTRGSGIGTARSRLVLGLTLGWMLRGLFDAMNEALEAMDLG